MTSWGRLLSLSLLQALTSARAQTKRPVRFFTWQTFTSVIHVEIEFIDLMREYVLTIHTDVTQTNATSKILHDFNRQSSRSHTRSAAKRCTHDSLNYHTPNAHIRMIFNMKLIRWRSVAEIWPVSWIVAGWRQCVYRNQFRILKSLAPRGASGVLPASYREWTKAHWCHYNVLNIYFLKIAISRFDSKLNRLKFELIEKIWKIAQP